MEKKPFKNIFLYITFGLVVSLLQAQKSYDYPFQNPKIATEKRIDNLLSLMTIDEKVNALSTNPEVPRLGVKGTGHVEGLHGLALGGPAGWGGKGKEPLPTTTFPQAYGLGETWDTELLKEIAKIEGYEARYALQKYGRGGLVIRAPNADLARDPRWGRTEESYGEDAFFNGKMTVAFVKGLQGSDKTYWQTASLMKHFLANSNEDGRTYTSSDFDERLWREYYALPISIARRLEVYDFDDIGKQNQKLFFDIISDYGKENIYFSNISIRTENDIKNNRKKNIYGRVPEALSALLTICENESLNCLEPTPYEKFIDINSNGVWDEEESFLDINENGKRDFNKKTILNNKYRLEIKDSISQDYNLSPYKVYVNVGGGVASFGYKNQERFEQSGYGLVSSDTVIKILTDEKGRRTKRGVIGHFSEIGIPIINFIEIEKILDGIDLKYFNRKINNQSLDSNQDGMIDVGKGNLYQNTKYNLTIVWIALLISLSSIFYIGLISYRQINNQMKDYNPND